MRACRNCGVELDDRSAFCPSCGASQASYEGSGASKTNQHGIMPKTMFYVMMIALALMGILAVGLAVRGPGTVTQTNSVTQMQFTTISFTSSTTTTQSSTVTVASFSTLLGGPPSAWFNQQYCGYPFNPYHCNEGPPVTVTGYLTNDTSCVDLYVGSGETYVVWNLPKTFPTGAYQVYGFLYPNWPPTQPFPPYPFQKTICVGIPLWAVPPYIQNA
jgi:zinc-ribbon domain